MHVPRILTAPIQRHDKWPALWLKNFSNRIDRRCHLRCQSTPNLCPANSIAMILSSAFHRMASFWSALKWHRPVPTAPADSMWSTIKCDLCRAPIPTAALCIRLNCSWPTNVDRRIPRPVDQKPIGKTKKIDWKCNELINYLRATHFDCSRMCSNCKQFSFCVVRHCRRFVRKAMLNCLWNRCEREREREREMNN